MDLLDPWPLSGRTFNGDCKHYLLDRVALTLEANNGVGKVCIHTHASYFRWLHTRKLSLCLLP